MKKFAVDEARGRRIGLTKIPTNGYAGVAGKAGHIVGAEDNYYCGFNE